MSQKLDEIIAAARARTQALLDNPPKKEVETNTANLPSSLEVSKPKEDLIKHAEENTTITINGKTFDPYYLEGVGKLNAEQRAAVKVFGLEGQSGCLIGPAGTGKTTTMKAIVRAMILSGRIPILPSDMAHKYIKNGLPGIFGGSFTRIATRNLRDNTPADIQGNIHTIHRLMEFEPEIVTVWDEEKKRDKNIRIFKPTRNKWRPLPKELVVFNLDESSMVGLNLHTQLLAGIHPDITPQLLYIGDIAQLPPVMDEAILGYKLLELPVVELIHVYRHAGVIVNLANHIRTGHTIPPNKFVVPYSANLKKMPKKLAEEHIAHWNKEEDGSKVTIHLWKNRLEGEVGQIRALQNLNAFFKKEITEGSYDPLSHMILMPYNKAVGTIELNKHIAQFLGRQREAEVHEVIAGFQKWYLAVGDKIFYNREESIITKITRNQMYYGKIPQPASVTLDRWGHDTAGRQVTDDGDEFDAIDALININIDEDEERKNQSSHVVWVKKISIGMDDDDTEYQLKTASDINGLLFGYALTIHKAQGSQWPKVYCLFHNSHNRNLQRELLYTAITRAQKELYVICEPETFVQGVLSQHIVGNTLAEKAEYFKGKIDSKRIRDELFAAQEEAEQTGE